MYRLATELDIPKIMKIVRQIVVEMADSKNPQWDETYPLADDFLKDIYTQSLYVLEEDDEVKGFLTITEKAPKEYDELKWKGDKALVLYRLGVNPLNRKEGVATRLMQFAEQLAFEQGIRFLKGDTSELNVGMNRLFIKLQYEKVGQISIGDKEFLFNCYEKELIE